MNSTSRRSFRLPRVPRKALAPLVGALLLLGAGSRAFGATDDDLPQGRLGYRWTPDPPKQTIAMPDPVVIQACKYGGGAVVVLWLVKKLFGGPGE